MCEAIGLMCGTFDPPHAGHIQLAQVAAEQIPLARVLFVPVGQPPHKTTLTAAPHRLAMTALAIQGVAGFELDTADIDRPPPHYTATLLPLLRQRYPTAELWLLMGADSWHDLPHWHNSAAIMAQCRLAVLPRPGVAVAQVESTAVRWLTGDPLPISSTAIRYALAEGQSAVPGLSPAVAAYARQHALYEVGSRK